MQRKILGVEEIALTQPLLLLVWRIIAGVMNYILTARHVMLQAIVIGKVQLTTDGAEKLDAGVLMETRPDARMQVQLTV